MSLKRKAVPKLRKLYLIGFIILPCYTTVLKSSKRAKSTRILFIQKCPLKRKAVPKLLCHALFSETL